MSKKILIVDDSIIVRQQVGLSLLQASYEVIEAVDGVDGLAKVKANPDLALIICDVNMPEMGGLGLLAALKAEGALPCPVIMLTSEGQPELVAEAKKLGAKAWVMKPITSDLLVSAVGKIAK